MSSPGRYPVRCYEDCREVRHDQLQDVPEIWSIKLFTSELQQPQSPSRRSCSWRTNCNGAGCHDIQDGAMLTLWQVWTFREELLEEVSQQAEIKQRERKKATQTRWGQDFSYLIQANMKTLTKGHPQRVRDSMLELGTVQRVHPTTQDRQRLQLMWREMQ